jgi:hypothetical protein
MRILPKWVINPKFYLKGRQIPWRETCLIISTFAGLLGIMMILRSCYREYYPTDEMRRNLVEENWPKLEIANSVSCDSFMMDYKYSLTDNGALESFTYELTVKLKLQIINRGNAEAELIGIVYYDTLSDRDCARRIIFDKEYRTTQIGKIDSFAYKSYELLILPGDTLEIQPRIKLHYCKDEFSQVHLILIYQNDQKYFYDTYCWINVQTRPLKGKIEPNMIIFDVHDYAKIKLGGQDQKCYYVKDEVRSIKEFETDTRELLKKKYMMK